MNPEDGVYVPYPEEHDDFDIYEAEFEEAYEEQLEQELEEKADKDIERVKPRIEDTVTQVKVVTDRELKVRLEREFFPWVTGRALIAMLRQGIIRRVGYPGRPSKRNRTPESFFTLYGTDYNKISGIIEEKRDISRDINAILTAQAPAGTQAENLFEKAFLELGFKIHARDASEFRGKKVRARVIGKQLPDLDFIVEKDRIIYGVDVKNWIKYEYATRKEVRAKVNLALDLDVAPFIIARYVDKETLYKEVYLRGGICYPYDTLLIPPSYESLADKAGSILGYPVLPVDVLPVYKVRWIAKLHQDFLVRRGK